MREYQLDIFGNWIPVDFIRKCERLDKNYKVKFHNQMKKYYKKRLANN